MAALRGWLNGIGRAAQSRIPSYSLHATRTVPATSSSGVIGIPTTAKQPIGGLRGALTGFALGLGLASAYGYVYLLKEYHEASTAMIASVRELQESTQNVTRAFARVSALESTVKQVDARASSKEEVSRRNGELVRVYDALHEDVLDIRYKLLDIEQDLNRVMRAPASRQANGRLV